MVQRPSETPTASTSQVVDGETVLLNSVQSSVPTTKPSTCIALRKPIALPRREAFALIRVSRAGPGSVRGLIEQEVDDDDPDRLLHVEEEEAERGDRRAGHDDDLATAEPFAEKTADHVEEEADPA